MLFNEELANLELDLCRVPTLQQSGSTQEMMRLRMQMSVSMWRLTGTTGDGVNDTPSSQDLRIRCDGLPKTSSSVMRKPGIKVTLITPRCTCEGYVSHDWYGGSTCFQIAQLRCRG